MEKTAEQRLQDQLHALVNNETISFDNFVQKTAETLESDALEDNDDVSVERQETGETFEAAELEKEAEFNPFDHMEELLKCAAAHIARISDEEGYVFTMSPGDDHVKIAEAEDPDRELAGEVGHHIGNAANTISEFNRGSREYSPLRKFRNWRSKQKWSDRGKNVVDMTRAAKSLTDRVKAARGGHSSQADVPMSHQPGQ